MGLWGLFYFVSVRYPLMAIIPIDIDIIHYHTSGTWPSPLDCRHETPVGFGFSSSVSWSLVNVGLLAGPKSRLPLLSSLSPMFLGRLLSCHKSSQMFIHCWFLRTVCQCHCHHLPYFSFWLSWCYWYCIVSLPYIFIWIYLYPLFRCRESVNEVSLFPLSWKLRNNKSHVDWKRTAAWHW